MPDAIAMIDSLEHRLGEVTNLLREAGEAIMNIYANEFEITIKADKSPVTLADTHSSEIITDGLSRLFEGIPVLSEENQTINYDVRSIWDYYWLLDPLDGTKEFIKRSNEFCINLALMHRHQPVAGFIYQPVDKILFHAIGTGVVIRTDEKNETTKFSTKPALSPANVSIGNSRSLTIITSRTHRHPGEQTTIETIKAAGYNIDFTSMGSAIKFCLMTEGKVDAYLRYGPTSEWDTAAGHALLNAIGGTIIDTKNRQPLVYNKEQLLNPSFAALNFSAQQLIDYVL